MRKVVRPVGRYRLVEGLDGLFAAAGLHERIAPLAQRVRLEAAEAHRRVERVGGLLVAAAGRQQGVAQPVEVVVLAECPGERVDRRGHVGPAHRRSVAVRCRVVGRTGAAAFGRPLPVPPDRPDLLNGLVVAAEMAERGGARIARGQVAPVQADRLVELLERLAVPPQGPERVAPPLVRQKVAGIEPDRAGKRPERVPCAARPEQRGAPPVVRVRVPLAEPDRAGKRPLRLGVAAHGEQRHAPPVARLGVGRIKPGRLGEHAERLVEVAVLQQRLADLAEDGDILGRGQAGPLEKVGRLFVAAVLHQAARIVYELVPIRPAPAAHRAARARHATHGPARPLYVPRGARIRAAPLPGAGCAAAAAASSAAAAPPHRLLPRDRALRGPRAGPRPTPRRGRSG